MENRNVSKIKQLLERRAAIERQLRSAPMRVNSIAVIRERIKLRQEIEKINAEASGAKNCLIREVHPEWCVRNNGWA